MINEIVPVSSEEAVLTTQESTVLDENDNIVFTQTYNDVSADSVQIPSSGPMTLEFVASSKILENTNLYVTNSGNVSQITIQSSGYYFVNFGVMILSLQNNIDHATMFKLSILKNGVELDSITKQYLLINAELINFVSGATTTYLVNFFRIHFLLLVYCIT